MQRFSFLALFLVFFALACEEKMVVIPELTATDNGRVVLMEEITGVRCPNCPSGAAEVANISANFPGRVVSVNYHTPFLGNPLEESHYNFLDDEDDRNEPLLIEQYLGQYIGKPSVAINRTLFDDESRIFLATQETWNAYVQEQLNIAPEMLMTIIPEYDATTRELTATVNIVPQGDYTGDYRIHAMVTESHIIDVQEDTDQIIEEYEHNHIFRHLLTENIEGDALASSLNNGEIITKTFTYTLPDEDGWWVAENCEVVAFISKVDGSAFTISQAAEAHVVE